MHLRSLTVISCLMEFVSYLFFYCSDLALKVSKFRMSLDGIMFMCNCLVRSLQEAFMCVEELRSPNSLSVFVSFAMNYVLEKKQHAMNLTGTLLHELLIRGVLSHEQFEKG